MSEELSLREQRLAKLERLREIGLDPYRVERFPFDKSANELIEGFQEGEAVTFGGRVVSYRLMGKAGFAHLSDGDGKIQAYFKKDDLTDAEWEAYTLLDIGDHVGITGELFVTKTGEKSIHARSLQPLSKALHAIPIGKEKDGERWYGLHDVEQRYRHRHLDLIANPEARQMLLDRCRIVSAVRRYFDSNGYLEVETPMLQLVAGGAAARPFMTHYNAYDIEVKLRISLELYLKRIICGDVPRVYEIGRVFRNEGVSNRHNPEFTLLEFYEAYANLEDMMKRVEDCFAFVAREVFGTTTVRPGIAQYQPNYTFDYADELTVIGVNPRLSMKRLNPPASPVDKEPTRIHEGEAVPTGFPNHSFELVGIGIMDLYDIGDEGPLLYVADAASIKFHDQIGNLGPGWWVATGVGESISLEELRRPRPVMLDFSKPWKRVSLLEEIERHTGLKADELQELDAAIARSRALGVEEKAIRAGGRIDLNKETNLGGYIEKLLEVFVEPTLIEPTFVVGYPIETSPLAKKDPDRPGFTRRFEGYILGKEVCNAFSEINDPIDQRERFEQQVSERDRGDDEAHPMDEEFIYALESGMPPTGGVGIGMDRMAMMLTGGETLREVLLFPMMKPEA